VKPSPGTCYLCKMVSKQQNVQNRACQLPNHILRRSSSSRHGWTVLSKYHFMFWSRKFW
jgi:hypothetical protein